MANNAWLKLAAVTLAGIIIIFAVLWGFGQFQRYNSYGNMNMGYGYQMNGMQMPQNSMMGNGYGMNMQGSMNMPGMTGNMQGGMQNGMGMMNGMQGGMGMMGGMGMH